MPLLAKDIPGSGSSMEGNATAETQSTGAVLLPMIRIAASIVPEIVLKNVAPETSLM